MTAAQPAPRFVSAGEALTDLIRREGGYWLARAGGAPWNVARVMAGFGIPSAFAGSVSRDNFGDEIAALSREAGLDMRFLQQHDKPSLLAIVHETSPPRYYFIGTDSADLAFDPRVLPRDWTRSVEWVHCGGISADVVKVSDEDLRGLFRTQNRQSALAQLNALNPRAVILLTLGADGAELHAQGKRLHQESATVEIVDTVGAGDASIGGLLYNLMHRPDSGWSAHLRRAVAAGTAACLLPGAAPPSLAAVERVLATMDQPRSMD